MKDICKVMFMIPLLLFAGSIDYSISLNPGDVRTQPIDGYDYVSIKDFSHLSEPGFPALPVQYLPFVIPPNGRYDRLEVVNYETCELPGIYNIFPTQEPVLTSAVHTSEFTPPDERVYALDEYYPERVLQYVHQGNLSGYTIVTLQFAPLQYNPVQQKLVLTENITCRIHYSIKSAAAKPITAAQQRGAQQRVQALVVNHHDVALFSPPVRTNGDVWQSEYVIITDTLFVDLLSPLRDWKMKKGLRSEIVTTSWIYSNYAGADNAEKVRNFISEAADSGAVYILLAGQCDWEHSEEYVPRRETFTYTTGVGSMPDEDTIPCDLYYADLDGTWDGNSNGTYGEMTDNVDMYSDVLVGRAPLKDSAQIENFISKVITYETAPSLPYIQKALLAVGHLHSGNHGTGMSDSLANIIPADWQKSKIYEDYGLMSRYVVRDSIDQGFHISNMMGHGNQTCITYSGGVYYQQDGRYEKDVDVQTNDSTEAIIITSNSCITGGVDKGWSATDDDCLAENMIVRNKHCALAVLMNTRFGWTYPFPEGMIGWTDAIIRWYYRKLFETELYHMGEVVAGARDEYVPSCVSNSKNRYCLFSLSLFGDPEMPIWTDSPDSLIVTHGPYVYNSAGVCTVTVTDGGGSPLKSALVCCWIPNQDPLMHVTTLTTATGQAFLSISPSTASDTMFITVTKHNFIPYQGHAIVVAAIPEAPHVAQIEKSGNDVTLIWNVVSTDTFNNPVTVDHYVIYRNTVPDFIPGATDSIGYAASGDTTYLDVGALSASESYYYLIKTVSTDGATSKKSNMGYKLVKVLNENTANTDKNWTSLPWLGEYNTASELTTDLSPAGNPLTKLTNLLDDQHFASWIWDSDFMEWYGADFTIVSGDGYEIVTDSDTFIVLVGCHDPDGTVSLNENIDNTDKNWVSIPYNAIYAYASDITGEYSVGGDPLTKLTNLRDDQHFESWIWDADFMEWYGADFTVVPGRGYEFVTITDTIWNPTEYSNETEATFFAPRTENNAGITVYLGGAVEPNRQPAWEVVNSKSEMANGEGQKSNGTWHVANSLLPMANSRGQRAERRVQSATKIVRNVECELANPEAQRPINIESSTRVQSQITQQGGYGTSHVVRGHLVFEHWENIVFTAYRPYHPYDALTEDMVGSGIAVKDGHAAIWFDVGNFRKPWQDGETVMLVVEAVKKGHGYFAVSRIEMNARVDIQEIGMVQLEPIPVPDIVDGNACWQTVDNEDVIGYSVYTTGKRRNDAILVHGSFVIAENIVIRPVFKGGYETVYASFMQDGAEDASLSHNYAPVISPNPFTNRSEIHYQLAKKGRISLLIYDATGRKVHTLADGLHSAGYYTIAWDGCDDVGRTVPAGVYFVSFESEGYQKVNKAILLR